MAKSLAEVVGTESGEEIPVVTILEEQKTLWESVTGQEYFRDRGIDPEVLKKFPLGMLKTGESGWFIGTYFMESPGVCVNASYRPLESGPRPFRRVSGKRQPLWNGQVLSRTTVNRSLKEVPTPPEQVFVAPRVLDALALAQLGVPPEEIVAHGENISGPFPEQWVKQLAKAKQRVYLVYGAEDLQGLSARTIWERVRQLGVQRAAVLPVPEPTAHAFLLAGATNEAFQKAIEAAYVPDVERVSQIGDAIERVRDNLVFEGGDAAIESPFRWPWEEMYEVADPPMPKHMVTFVARPKTGKTALLVQAALANAYDGLPGLYYCITDEDEDDLVYRVIESTFGVRRKEVTEEILTRAHETFQNVPFYLQTMEKQAAQIRRDVVGYARECVEEIRDSVERYGVRTFIFDHVHALIRGSRNTEQDASEISGLFKQFIAQEAQIGFVVVQPRKHDEGKKTSEADMLYTGAFERDSDMMIVLNREALKGDAELAQTGVSKGVRSPVTEVKVSGRRVDGGRVLLMFDGDFSRFRSLSPEEKLAAAKEYERREVSNRRGGRRRYGND